MENPSVCTMKADFLGAEMTRPRLIKVEEMTNDVVFFVFGFLLMTSERAHEARGGGVVLMSASVCSISGQDGSDEDLFIETQEENVFGQFMKGPMTMLVKHCIKIWELMLQNHNWSDPLYRSKNICKFPN